MIGVRRLLTGCQLAAIEVVDDAGYIAPSLPVRWNSLVFLHRPGAGIVCCQSFGGVSVVAQKQLAKISAAAVDIVCRIETIVHPELGRG